MSQHFNLRSLSPRTVSLLALALAVACASDETTNPNTNNNSGGSGGTAGMAGTAGSAGASGSTANGNSGSAGMAGSFVGTGGTAGTAGQPTAGTGGLGGFAGVPGGGAAGTAGGGAAGTAGGGTGGGGAAGTAGTAGTGGAPVVVVDPCDRTKWVASAVPVGGDVAGQAIDANANSRFSGGQDQEPGDYFQLVFPSAVTMDSITLVSNAATDFPVGFKVQYSTNGTTFEDMMGDGDGGVLTGAGVGGTPTLITLDSTPFRGLRIVLTATSTHWWSIYNLTAQSCLKYESGDAGADAGDAGDGG